jgi:hypothetical protein
MKPRQRHARPPVQAQLFGHVRTPLTSTSLPPHHDELVELLSLLLCQAVHDIDASLPQENSHEQD